MKRLVVAAASTALLLAGCGSGASRADAAQQFHAASMTWLRCLDGTTTVNQPACHDAFAAALAKLDVPDDTRSDVKQLRADLAQLDVDAADQEWQGNVLFRIGQIPASWMHLVADLQAQALFSPTP